MDDQNLAHFEAQLERLIEGAFAQIFSKTLRAQDIALHLARAMESAAELHPGDPRPIAPDHYAIRMNADVLESLLTKQPALTDILSRHMVELANALGYRLNTIPVIEIEADLSLSSGDITVVAVHIVEPRHQTAVMRRTELPVPSANERPRNAQLIINGEQTVSLTEPLVILGRSRDNHVVLDDPYVSRHHAQLRLRFGGYTLFDTQSQTGTFVNDVRIREHTLQSGDVIRMGRIQMVFLEDDPLSESQTRVDVPSES